MIKSKILTERNILDYLTESTASSSGSEVKYFDIKKIYNDSILNWSPSNKVTGSCICLGYGNRMYLAGIADDGLWKSYDGVNWTKVDNFKAPNSEMTPLAICYGQEKFIISTVDNGIYYSDPTLLTFTKIESPHVFRNIYYLNDIFVAAGYDGLFKSSDGIIWDKIRVVDGDEDNDPGFYGVVIDNERLVAASDDGMWYLDGTSLSRYTITDPDDSSDISDISFTSVIKYQDRLVAICEEFNYSGFWEFKDDNWVKISDSIYQDIDNPKKLFVVGSVIFILADNGVFYSEDGVTINKLLNALDADDTFNCMISDNNISLIGSKNGLYYNKVGYNSYYGHIEDNYIHVSESDRSKWDSAYNRITSGLVPDNIKEELIRLSESMDNVNNLAQLIAALKLLISNLTNL